MSDQDKDQERPLFQGMDEYEKTYAPQELPPDDPERQKVMAEEESYGDDASDIEPPSAAPVGALGTSPSGAMAAPNIGHREHGGAPGDPETEAEYPIGRDRPPTTDDDYPTDDEGQRTTDEEA